MGRLLLAALLLCAASVDALAQKRGGTLRIYSPDSPASMSIHEEATVYSQGPMMGVFNNLIMIDQSAKQGSLDTVVNDLATQWSWNADKTQLTFDLHQGVKWHDGKPFTSADVVCTFDLLLEKAVEKFRVNPRKVNFRNLDRVEASGDHRVVFHLKRPQPAFPMLLATGFAPIYPCHVPPAQMRRAPIGTGPFKFAEFKANEFIRVERNPDYWKPGLPYLDAIEYRIIKNSGTAKLAFQSGLVDMTFPYDLLTPVYKNIKAEVPDAVCEMNPAGGVNRHVLMNRTVPPFDNPDIRLAVAYTVDRQSFVDIITEGEGDIGGILQPQPGGRWGMPPDRLAKLPGYGTDIAKNRAQGQALMKKLGYGPDNMLKVKLSTRDIATYRDPAIILIDQLKHVYIAAELETVDTPVWFPRLFRKDYVISLNLQTSGPDPDPILDLYYSCGAILNPDGYCKPEIDKAIADQSAEGDPAKRREMVWDIERRLAEDGARPILFYTRGGTCWRPYVKGVTIPVNSLYNGNRRETWWLDK